MDGESSSIRGGEILAYTKKNITKTKYSGLYYYREKKLWLVLLTARVKMAWEYLYNICIILLQILLYSNMYY
jgi:hypothetical protein